jgi:hypothetical protein
MHTRSIDDERARRVAWSRPCPPLGPRRTRPDHTYAIPRVVEVPRPVAPDCLDPSLW